MIFSIVLIDEICNLLIGINSGNYLLYLRRDIKDIHTRERAINFIFLVKLLLTS
ncbi:hypothetical protein NIES25_53550 (plasmid) [Nostoc linckia NIES-25]|nr:hypothetical protein NIES25_53550 [Nostoc linckia NIES-25]